MLSARYVAVRRSRRGGVVDAVGQSERVVAASAAGGAAPRGVGRREVLSTCWSGSRDIPRYIDLMELQYLVLALGFTGKYQMLDRGHERLAELQQISFARSAAIEGRPNPVVAAVAGTSKPTKPSHSVCALVGRGAASMPISWGRFRRLLREAGDSATPLHARLAQVGVEDFLNAAAVAARSGSARSNSCWRQTDRRPAQ